MEQYIMALDQGTTSSRTIIFNGSGDIVAVANRDFPSTFPKSGWVEQDPEEIWESQKVTIEESLKIAGLSMGDISGIGITNQRETTIAWNPKTGQAIGPAIVWQCRRTANYCRELIEKGYDRMIADKTGLVTDAYFSGTKMRWILKENQAAQQAMEAGELKFGTVDSWLIWKLSGGESHVTDVSNASRTLLFNIFDTKWDEELLELFEIPLASLPEVKGSSEIVAYTDSGLWGAKVPIAGVAGDQQAALFGQTCFEAGMAKNTYGTGCFLLLNTGENAVKSENKLLTTIAWKIGDQVTYALEGSVFIAGSLVQWLRDNLRFFKSAEETEAIAMSVPDTGGVYIVPAFVGLGAPHWDSYARGLMIGLTRDTSREHIVRACLEAIAYQSYDLLKALEQDTGIPLKELKVDGGATANGFLCQFQADILGTAVSRPEIVETTAMGAAFLAGLAVGVWKDFDHIRNLWKEDKRFLPGISADKVNELVKGWTEALSRSKAWLSDDQ